MAQSQLRIIFYTEVRPKETIIYASNSLAQLHTTNPNDLEQINITLFADEVDKPQFFMLTDAEKEATYKKWPKSEGKLRMLFEGVVFKID